MQLARRKVLVVIVFPLVTKIGVTNGYHLYIGKIGCQNLILKSAVSISSQVVNLLFTIYIYIYIYIYICKVFLSSLMELRNTPFDTPQVLPNASCSNTPCFHKAGC